MKSDHNTWKKERTFQALSPKVREWHAATQGSLDEPSLPPSCCHLLWSSSIPCVDLVDHPCRWVPPPDGMPFLTNVPFTIQSTEDRFHILRCCRYMQSKKVYLIQNLVQSASIFFFKRHPSSIVRVWKSITGWLVFLRTSQSFFSQPEFPGAWAWLLHSGLVTDRKSRSVLRPAPRSVRQRLCWQTGCWAQGAHRLFLLRMQGKGFERFE